MKRAMTLLLGAMALTGVSANAATIVGAMGMITFFITPTPMPGQFLLKDLISFGACLWVLGTSLAEARARRLP